jgi:hypothetical protein
MKNILPSMPKGEIVGNMATAEMTQMIKVVIDGNRLFMKNRRTQRLKHRRCNTDANTAATLNTRCNTNANTDAATQMRKQSWNTEANADG